MKNSPLMMLIPPSEGKKVGGTPKPCSLWNEDVLTMIEKLNQVNDASWSNILGVKGKALAHAIEANQRLKSAPTMPAIERYTGVVYNAIDYASMSSTAQCFFNQHVRIVSALFGLVAPQDFIPEYKLKIDKLGADKYWRPVLAQQLNHVSVLDLLPQAHRKAVKYSQGCAIDFLIIKNGKNKPAGHQGKHIKGRFIRWVCEHKATDPDQWRHFNEEGFAWQDGVFVKKD